MDERTQTRAEVTQDAEAPKRVDTSASATWNGMFLALMSLITLLLAVLAEESPHIAWRLLVALALLIWFAQCVNCAPSQVANAPATTQLSGGPKGGLGANNWILDRSARWFGTRDALLGAFTTRLLNYALIFALVYPIGLFYGFSAVSG